MTEHPEGDPSIPAYRYTAKLAGDIESRWQERWAKRGTFEVPNPSRALADGSAGLEGCDWFYVLDMFPYPSGAGLHVGHPLGYIASDIYARFLRMKGYSVLHPFGFDAFGLPAEQYAIETGKHPTITTAENIDNMRWQLRRLGLAHDPRREVSTADPRYYRWTQWIFLQIFGSWFDAERQAARPIESLVEEFEQGVRAPDSPTNPDSKPWRELDAVERRKVVDSYRLAYLDEAPVNWCPGLGTVLANEEVTDEGRSEIGNFPVYRRRMRQWMLRITAYADRLLQDLDPLDWTDSLKTIQRNWIGRSEGADIRFTAATATGATVEIVVYTTRPDTLFGAMCLALAPEHPLVEELTAPAWPPGTPQAWRGPSSTERGPAASPTEAVDAYRQRADSLSDRQRQAQREKTAVFTGAFATNPASGESVPIFVADYVLASYGGGAIMGVPAHDQRDFEFARQQPPGHWHLFAGAISRKHSQTIDQDAKLNFAVSNAMLDAGITSWNAKRRYDFIRPVTAVRTTQAGKTIKAWAGPGQGTKVIPAEQFRSYIPTPPFPDYVSGHSTFSAAAAQVLRSFTGSDTLNLTVNFAAGSSFVEPGTVPAAAVPMGWSTYTVAAGEAGLSREYGGIHFRDADAHGLNLGRAVGTNTWNKAQTYFQGIAAG